MGLIKEGERFAVLSDILGDEDHLGDMDFKVAGTEERHHLAADGHQDRRHHRRDHEDRARPGQGRPPAYPRRNGQGAAGAASGTRRVRTAHRGHAHPDRQDPRRHRLGRQGHPRDRREDRRQDQHRGRRHGQDRFFNAKEIEAAKKWIHTIVAEPEVGEIYEGTVVKTADFGAFVNFFGPRDGLVHISQLANDRVAKTSDVVKEGDKVWVKLMGFDERGKVRLSMKVVDQATGKEIARDKKTEGEENAA